MGLNKPKLVTAEVKRSIESRAAQGPGRLRSITFAAILSIAVPLAIAVLTGYFGTPRQFISVAPASADSPNRKRVTISNDANTPIESFTVNFSCGRARLVSIDFLPADGECGIAEPLLPSTRKVLLAPDGLGDTLAESPTTQLSPCSVRISNLCPRGTLTLILTLSASSGELGIQGIVGNQVYLNRAWWSRLWVNDLYFFMLLLLVVFLFIAAWYVVKYARAAAIAFKLTRCVNMVVADLSVEDTNPYKGESETFFYERCRAKAQSNDSLPRELLHFDNFTGSHSLVLRDGHINNGLGDFICFAPFDFMGNPTFSRVLGNNQRVLFLHLDKQRKIEEVHFEELKDVMTR